MNAFFEAFLVKTGKKNWKTHSEVLFQDKKNSENVFRNIYSRAKIKIRSKKEI
jgi:hypothetical protein